MHHAAIDEPCSDGSAPTPSPSQQQAVGHDENEFLTDRAPFEVMNTSGVFK
jgi:hypothetical protein